MGEDTNHHIHTNNADLFKGSPEPIHFIFEINVGKSRIRHRTTLNLNDVDFESIFKFIIQFRVLLCRMRPFPTWISKLKWLGFGLPLEIEARWFNFERLGQLSLATLSNRFTLIDLRHDEIFYLRVLQNYTSVQKFRAFANPTKKLARPLKSGTTFCDHRKITGSFQCFHSKTIEINSGH